MKLCLLLSASLSNAFTTTLSSAKKLSLLLLLSLASISFIQAQTTVNFSPSTTTWTCPVGVTSVVVECWGAGGAGGGNTTGSDGGGGGGGGAYSKSTITVVPGTVYTVHAGAGGNGVTGTGGVGADSWFNTAATILAKGGGGGFAPSNGNGGVFGTGGAAGSGIGTLKFSGGNGGTGINSTTGQGGPGGSSAGTGANGTSGPTTWTTTTAAAAPTGGGRGGNGGTSGNNGSAAVTGPGGGGGGAGDVPFGGNSRSGGDGADGQVSLTFTQLTYKSQLVSMSLGSTTWCQGETRTVSIQIKNIGTATWDDVGKDINVGVKWNTNGSNWTDYHVRVDAQGLAPGATGTYSFTITASNATIGPVYGAPLSTGTNNLTFDVVYEAVSWFGDNNGGVGPGNTKFISPNQTIVAGPTVSTGAALAAICQGGTSAALGGLVGGSATGGTWSDGGIGGTFTPNANTLNATWKPPVSYSGIATLTLTTSGGSCGTTSASKNITVNATPTASAGSALSAICQGGTSAPLGGSVGGSATGGTWSTPAGGSFSPNANTLNATWTPPAAFTGTATLTLTSTGGSPCSAATSSKAQVVTPTATVNAGADLPAICQGGTTGSLGGSVGGSATGGIWSDGGIGGTFNPSVTNLNATWTPPANYNGTATLTLTATGGCGSPADTKSQIVNAAPASVVASPASSTICFGSTISLTGSGTLSGTSSTVIDNFNGTPTFTATGTSTGNRSQVWQQELSGSNVNSVATFTSPGGGSLMVSTAGTSVFLGSSSVNSILTSSIINTTTFSSLSFLTFDHSYRDGNSSGTGIVEVSTDGGATWTTLITFNSNQGSSTSFNHVSIAFGPYVNMTNLKIRFNFTSANNLSGSSWWAIDDVTLNGVKIPLFSWTANTASGVNGLPAGAGVPSASNANIIVNPKVTTSYTLTATNPTTNCMASGTPVVVNVNPLPTLGSITDATLNTSADGTGNCSTVYHWTHPSVNTACPTTLSVAYTAGSPAPASLPSNGTVTPGSAASVTFSTGVTIVTYTAKDQNNNIATTSFKVTVTDDELPGITCSADVTIPNTTGQCGATVTLTAPMTSDNCGVASITNDHPSNDYPVGTTDVTWTVKDNSDNVQTCVQKVTVKDTQLPTITCNDDVSVYNDLGLCSATVNLTTPATNDNCGVASITNDHPSNTFPVGVTTVKWTVTDNSGNIATCNQTVTVTDNEKPVITCPAPVTTVTDLGASYATITLEQPGVTDNCSVNNVVNDHPSSHFPIGTTLVKWTATDIHSNSNTCIQTIIVNDTIQPSIASNPPINIYNNEGDCSGSTDVSYPEASDNSGHVTVTSDYAGLPTPSVDPVDPLTVNPVNFPVGPTTIIWTASDPSANTSWSLQSVLVTDNEKPTITCPGDIEKVNDPGNCSAVIDLGTPVTSDNCGVASVTNDHPSNVFSVGETIVTWTVTDIHGNKNTCTQKVTVKDIELPTIVCSGDVSMHTDLGKCFATVTLTTPATDDNCDVASITNDHPAATFDEGVTNVTWTVTDIHGNTNTCIQKVTVTDNELPVITASANINQTADAGKCGATIIVTNAIASDNCGVGVTHGVRNDEMSLTGPYPVGTTTITWTVTDIHGNAAIPVEQTVTVTDDELPVITASSDISVYNKAGDCGAGVNIIPATATDNCSVDAPQGMRSDGLALTDPYPVGITTITWAATDIHNNAAIDVVQKITVTDNERPVITASANVNQTADPGVCGALINVSVATAKDNCGVGATHGVRSDWLSLSAPYPVGTTTITWTVTDIHGNAAIPVLQTVTVTDDEIPVITVSDDVNVNNDPGECGASVEITPATASDNCGVDALTGTRSDGLSLNALYSVGTTTITWTATDIHGNHAVEVIQSVNVTDNEAPEITAASDISVTNDAGKCGATVTIVPATAKDNCSVGATTGARDDGLSLTALYPVGTTTITWTVTDIHGNPATAVKQYVNVNDNEIPVLTASPDVNVNSDPKVCGAVVTIIPAAVDDNCSVVDPVIGTRSDGLALTELYPVGNTIITWNAKDIHDNAALPVTQSITVTDNESPVIAANDNITQTADAGKCGATVTIVPATATDNCGVGAPTGTRNDALSLSDLYPVGTTFITWAATDIHGNPALPVTQTVTVTDDEAPKITSVGDQIRSTNAGKCEYKTIGSEFDPTAFSDNCPGPTISNNYNNSSTLAGAIFLKGTTTVIWTVTDVHGHTTTCSFKVTVNDNEKPTITCPTGSPFTRNANNGSPYCSYKVSGSEFDPSFSDNCSGVTIKNNFNSSSTLAGAILPNGPTTIIWTATDASGLTATCSITVNVGTTLAASCTNNNAVLYYGYTLDQSATITVKPTGGTGPYKVSITMNRPINCNMVNSSGDEVWAPGASTASNSSIACPGSGPALANPVSTSTSTITSATGYSVTATLMQDAVITATITDANGCTTTCSTSIHAEDVRCFAGNSGNAKVTVCHQTGSKTNPCVTICVDQSAVAEHLAHGDYLGKCTVDCKPPAQPSGTSSSLFAGTIPQPKPFSVKVTNNPSFAGSEFGLTVQGDNKEPVNIIVTNMYGEKVFVTKGGAVNTTYRFGANWRSGTYIIQVIQGNNIKTLKIVKGEG